MTCTLRKNYRTSSCSGVINACVTFNSLIALNWLKGQFLRGPSPSAYIYNYNSCPFYISPKKNRSMDPSARGISTSAGWFGRLDGLYYRAVAHPPRQALGCPHEHKLAVELGYAAMINQQFWGHMIWCNIDTTFWDILGVIANFCTTEWSDWDLSWSVWCVARKAPVRPKELLPMLLMVVCGGTAQSIHHALSFAGSLGRVLEMGYQIFHINFTAYPAFLVDTPSFFLLSEHTSRV
jgi:hypothetical protein